MTRMVEYGGSGGVWGTREIDKDDKFEMLVADLFGDRMRKDDEFCRCLWGALSNIIWRHDNGDTATYSFRRAGDVIAAVRGEGNYADWYCSSPYGVVPDEISMAMAAHGWSYKTYEDD